VRERERGREKEREKERVCCKLISAKKTPQNYNFNFSLQKSLSAKRNYAVILFFMA